MRAALHKLKEGASIEDAKAVYEPEIIKQIIKWKVSFQLFLKRKFLQLFFLCISFLMADVSGTHLFKRFTV